MRILLVEDDFTNRFVLQKMLVKYGDCDIAVNGKEAVKAYSLALEAGKPYEIIFLDIMMPEMNGREALRIIREKEKESGIKPSEETKIIMTTALDTPEEVINAYYRGGCTNYMVKPIDRKKLESVIKELNFLPL